VDIETDMSVRRHVPRLVLVTAALASIATQPVIPEWVLDQQAPFEAQILDDPEPTRTIALQGVLSSSQALSSINGSVSVHLELRARDVSGVHGAEVTVTLNSAGRVPESRILRIPPGGTAIVDLFQPAFERCATEMCVEDYTLSIRRTALADDPIVDVTGQIAIEAHGIDGDVPPPGTLLDLDVTDLGPQP
jgi:hypothetical protein